MAKTKEKLVLVDTMGIIHRAYHAYPELTTSNGLLVNAVYGFGIMFFQILKNLKPDLLIFCSDAKEKTFKSEKFTDYKANRAPTQDSLKNQFSIIYDLISATGFPLYMQSGYEADDIIGSIATQYSNKYDIFIVTGDKDLLQLIDKNISVVLPGKTFSDMRTYTPSAFNDRFGFDPEWYVYYKALVGDASDNIKGAKGIGEKTATDLIKRYNTLGGIFENIEDVKERYRKILLEYKDILFSNLELVDIHKDLTVECDFKLADLKQINVPALIEFFKKYEFPSLISNIAKLKLGDIGSADIPIDEKELIKLDAVSANGLLDEQMPYFIVSEGEYIYFDDKYNFQKLSKCVPNTIGFDIKSLYREGHINFSKKVGDLQLLAYCLDPAIGNFDLYKLYKHLYRRDIDLQYEVSADGIDKGSAYKIISFVKCFAKIKEDIKAKQLELYEKVELPILPILAEMEKEGVHVNSAYFKKLHKEFEIKIQEIKSKIFESVGHEFNPNSTKELSEVLFEELKLPKLKKIKSGFSTDERTISKLLGVHPIIELILEYREYTKLQSTYVVGLQKLIKDERIHTDLRQNIVPTGRLSSVNPNLQNIPTRSELGKQIRKAFIPSEGSVFVSLDYSQIDLRSMAHISGDEELIKAFVEGKDIHTNTASLMFGVPESEVTSEQRRVSKMINFGIIYGISGFGLSDRLGGSVDQKTAKEFIEKYFERYPKVKQYFEDIKEQLARDGYVETLLGRRRYFNLEVGNYMLKQALYREAINMPIQGASADIMKLAMLDVHKLIKHKYADEVKMILQIHDELIFEIKDNKKVISSFIDEAKEAMESVMKLKVPLVANAKQGDNWGDLV